MSELKNVDDVLVKSMNEQLSANNQPTIPEPLPKAIEAPAKPANDDNDFDTAAETKQPEIENKTPEVAENLQSGAEKPKIAENDPIDEYGNPIEKPKMYSEDEVQSMIRDRLSRGRYAEQPNQQQVEKAAKDFKEDPNSEETWDVQLKNFVKDTLKEVSQEQREAQWREEENRKQMEFQEKFTLGMEKYKDFRQVVAAKPITDAMMLAARNLDNPAAFIYGAAKLYPKELERISQISDQYAQAAEIGRLHEKMIKVRQQSANTTKPIEVPKGDMAPTTINHPSLEERIHSYGKQKMGRR